jgi:TPR repeat protein
MLSINVSAMAENSVWLESSIRNAWKTNDCKLAKSLMDKMEKTLSPEIFYFYQAEAFEYGDCIDKDIDRAITAYAKSYGISQRNAQIRLAVLYLREKKDIQTARKWLRTLAFSYAQEPDNEVNTPKTQSQLIKSLKEMYANDLRDSRDFPEDEFDQAFKWATELFDSSPDKIFEYALIFEKGAKGYPINENAAARLLHRVVMLDYPPAAWHYAQQLIKKNGEEEERNLYRVLNPLEKAALGGILEAQLELAKINQKLARYSKSYSWYLFARQNGAHVDEEISQLAKQLEPSKVKYLHRKIDVRGKLP